MNAENLAELVERVKGHTPEPWTVAHDADGDYTIFAGSTTLAITWHDTERAKANGEIMRAAPSLLTLALEQAEELNELRESKRVTDIHAVLKQSRARAESAEAELTTLRASLEQAQKDRDRLQGELTSISGGDGFLCGLLHGVAGKFVGGCGKHVSFADSYRCADCTASFHRECIGNHLKCENIALRAELEQVRGAWVSVEERLPEPVQDRDGDPWLVQTTFFKYPAHGWYFPKGWIGKDHNGWVVEGVNGNVIVTHWRPLPAPPSPSKEGR